jgi:16S rRNA processing protein RimM
MLEVGRIVSAHGLRGMVIVDLWTDRTERLDPGMVLHTERGDLTVVSSQPNKDQFLVQFAEITDRPGSEAWRGTLLSAERLEVEGVLWVDQLFGATVQTPDGVTRGTVVSVEENPASDLMVLDNGALVPMVFVTEVQANHTVIVDVPEGLFP